MKSKSTPEQIADNTINLGKSVKSDEICVFVLGLTAWTDKINEKETKVDEVLQRKGGTINLPFKYFANILFKLIDNSNI